MENSTRDMEKDSKTFGISRTSGFVISLVAILLAALLVLPAVFTVMPSARDEAVGVLIASIIFPLISLFRPLQEFTLFPDGLGFSTIFSKRIYKVSWADVSDVRMHRDMFGVTNLEFKQRGKKIYKKVPLTIMPEHRTFLRQLFDVFPLDHPKRIFLEHLISSFSEERVNF